MQDNDDIAKQYQQILNQYANEITPQPSSPAFPPATPTPTPTPTPAPPTPASPPLPPPEVVLTPPPKPAPANNFFKYFFFFSVFIFLSVVAALVYSILSSQQIINYKKNTIPTVPASVVTPTPVISDQTGTPSDGICQLNDKNYRVGESFSAADGCNSCSCQPDLTIKCTENECPVEP